MRKRACGYPEEEGEEAVKLQDPAGLRCSFCTKAHAEVKKMIAGPNDVAICDECVDLCQRMIAGKPKKRKAAKKR